MTAIRFSAVVLAAGTSSRMQGRNKLLLPINGEPIIRRVVRAVLAAEPCEAVVVTGFERQAVADAVVDLPVRVQPNPHYEQGQMTSVAAGAAALGLPTDAVMVCLGDMAGLAADDYRELVAAYASLTDPSILVPRYQGNRGNPVIFAAAHLPALLAKQRNPGSRKLIDDYQAEVFAYEVAHDRFLTDVDTPEDYARMLATADIALTALNSKECHG